MSARREVGRAEARRIAKRYGVRVPRVGYEMSLGEGRWLASTGHSQFGWFERSNRKPYEVRCRCTEGYGIFGGCTADCPVKL